MRKAAPEVIFAIRPDPSIGMVPSWKDFAYGFNHMDFNSMDHDFLRLNVFRQAGDISHILAWVALLAILCCSRSAVGLSLRTLELYLLVFAMRYQDLAWNFMSAFNWVIKASFLTLALVVVAACHCVPALRRTQNRKADMRPLTALLLLVLPACVLGYMFNQDRTSPFEVAWASSLYLEAVAAVPQLVLMVREASCRSAVSHYIFLLASYRAWYIANWVWRYIHEPGFWQPQAWAAGIVQTVLYLPFFVIYCRAKLCCLRPHANVELVELHSLMCAEDGNGAGPLVEFVKFVCPSCGETLRDELKVGAVNTARCQCGETFQVNLEPPSATEEASCAAHASAEFFSFSAAAGAARV